MYRRSVRRPPSGGMAARDMTAEVLERHRQASEIQAVVTIRGERVRIF